MVRPAPNSDSCEHVCHLFRTFEEQKAVVVPFFREGVQHGEQCIYITSDQHIGLWQQELAADSSDLEDALRRGAMVVLGKSAWRPADSFNTLVKAREALGLFSGILRDFEGVRIAGDASWALNPDLPVEQLCHWEATANLIYEGQNIRAICQYNLTQHSAPNLHTALRTHPLSVFEGRLMQNPFYEGRQILEDEPASFGSDATDGLVEAMLNQLRTLR